MELTYVLECRCNPLKTYSNLSTYNKHKQSQRHQFYDLKEETKLNKKQIFRLERTISQLEKENEQLKYFVDHPRRRRVSEKNKKIVASRQSWRCSECRALLNSTYQVDHKIPLYKGGSNAISNLFAMCVSCHAKKTQKD
jgi:5-methylcytosine-specific restriction endonuclease McrA